MLCKLYACMFLICLVENWYITSVSLVCFESAMYRFHSNGFLNKTKFLKLESFFTLRLVKFGLIDFRDLIKMKFLLTRIKSISTRFLHLRISDRFVFGTRQKSNTFKNLEVFTIKNLYCFLETPNSCRFKLDWCVYACLLA